MNESDIYKRMRQALANAPYGQTAATLHLQMIKYADELRHVPVKELLNNLGLSKGFGVEVNKMRNIASQLKKAGLDTGLL